MTARLSLVLTMFLSPLAFAAAPDCVYNGEPVLQCDGNILVPAGTLVTHDQAVVLMTSKAVVFGTPGAATNITCADADDRTAGTDLSCGKVVIWANTLFGALDVKATAEGRTAGAIEVVVGSYATDFKMKLETEPNLLFVQRSGQDHTADDAVVRWASR